MLNLKHIESSFFRYPLMAVMLLWALTLPGQEVEVYGFLIEGTAASTSQNQATAAEKRGKPAIAKQAVQVFQDAKITSAVVVSLQQAVSNPMSFLAFAAPAHHLLPACAANPARTKLLDQLLTVAILPNAP